LVNEGRGGWEVCGAADCVRGASADGLSRVSTEITFQSKVYGLLETQMNIFKQTERGQAAYGTVSATERERDAES